MFSFDPLSREDWFVNWFFGTFVGVGFGTMLVYLFSPVIAGIMLFVGLPIALYVNWYCNPPPPKE